MLAKKIDHVAIAVKDLDAAIQTFTRNFAFPVQSRALKEELHQRWALLPVADTFLELFQPTSDANRAAQFLSERGEGLYALSLEVESVADAADHLVSKGIPVKIQTVHEGLNACFISPEHTHGVLISLIEHTDKPGG